MKAKREDHIGAYESWTNMKQRCNNKNNITFKNYGGRGITYDRYWEYFEFFLEDMGDRPEGMTIERIDNNSNYTKDNCCWDTRANQALNKRKYKNSGIATGVYRTEYDKFKARGYSKGITTHLGTFKSEWDAICARKSWETTTTTRK